MAAMDHQPPSDVPDPDDVERAARRIAGRVRRTPLLEHGSVTLKLELLQHAGSFKPRGAFNRVLIEPSIPESGLIAASGGNHGAAVAFVARALGVSAEVFVPATSPAVKRAQHRAVRGHCVAVVEGLYDDAQRQAEVRQACTGALMVHPFDHPATVAGQGTMARELDEQLGWGDRHPRGVERRRRVHRWSGGVVPGSGAHRERGTGHVAVPCAPRWPPVEPVDVAVSGVAS